MWLGATNRAYSRVQGGPVTLALAGQTAGFNAGITSVLTSGLGTPLAVLAASMSAGSWAQMSPAPANIHAVIDQGSVSGNALGYGNKCAYDAYNDRIWILGCDHNDFPTRHMYYDVRTNAFTDLGHLPNPPFTGSSSGTGNSAHAYDHLNWSAQESNGRGALYWRLNGAGGGGCQIGRWSTDLNISGNNTASWTIDTTSLGDIYNDQNMGTAILPAGAFTGVGVAGAFIVFSPVKLVTGENGVIGMYDIASGSWSLPVSNVGVPQPGGSGLNSIAIYSPVYNCLVVASAQLSPRSTWRIDSDWSVHAMTTAPHDIGIQAGNFNLDPVTGNLLLYGGVSGTGTLWELNPSGTGTWTQQGGARVPPAGLNKPDVISGSGDGAIVSCAISTCGVVVYLSAGSAGGATCQMWLYKHADMKAQMVGSATFATTLDTQSAVNAVAGIQPGNQLGSDPRLPVFDSTIAPPTFSGSMRIDTAATDGAASGEAQVAWGGNSYTTGQTVYVYRAMMQNAAHAYTPWSASNAIAQSFDKRDIISNTVGSHTNFELVHANQEWANLIGSGYFNQNDGTTPPVQTTFNTPCQNGDIRWLTNIDYGSNPLNGTDPDSGSAWTACQQARGEYSLLYSALGAPNFARGIGDPIGGGPRFEPGYFWQIQDRVDIGTPGTLSTRWRRYVARWGCPWVKVHDLMVNLGADGAVGGNGLIFNCIYLLPYATLRTPGDGAHVVSRTGTMASAFDIAACGWLSAAGSGTLTFYPPNKFGWASSGHAEGSHYGFSAPNSRYLVNAICQSTAQGEDCLSLYVKNPAALPGGQTSETVVIGSGRPATSIYYGPVLVGATPQSGAGGHLPIG